MGNLLRMDLYRMRKARGFSVCLILSFLLGLASTPLSKLMFSLTRMLSPDETPIPFPETANLSEMIGKPVSMLIAMLCMLSVVIFFHADMESGYIKNIAGQMPKRGFTILSRYLAAIGHNLTFMLAGLAGNLIGTAIFQRIIVDSAVASSILTFFLKLLLLQSICAILLMATAGLRSKSLGMVLAVLFGLTATSLLYAAIDSALGLVLKTDISISPYMPDTLLSETKPDTLRAVLSSAVTIGIFLPLSICVFDRRDVK